MAEQMPPLSILVQPKALYRERYVRDNNQAQRFLHGEGNPNELLYPKILIPEEWIQRMRQPYYVRLALVTVPNAYVHDRCVHPYKLETDDTNVIKDLATNSLYFLVSDSELQSRQKTFQFCLLKLTQNELRIHGPLRIMDSDKVHKPHLLDVSDPKKIINLYQLSRSQLIFSLATFVGNIKIPVTYAVSSVYSQVIVGTLTVPTDNVIQWRCAPCRGDYNGGDEVMIYVARFDRRKKQNVFFDYHPIGPRSSVSLTFIDDKTVSFSTPPCPVALTRENPTHVVPIVVTQNDIELIRIDFTYQSFQTCLDCNANLGRQHPTAFGGHKRPLTDSGEEEEEEEDDIQCSSSVLNHPKRNVNTNQLHLCNSSRDIWASTSNTREENSLSLPESIQRGNIYVTSDFLDRQNQEGETPLLLPAEFNRNDLRNRMLQRRLELVSPTDRQGNHVFHSLANVCDNRATNMKDSANNVVTQMRLLALTQTRNEDAFSDNRSSAFSESDSEFEPYLNQLKDALASYVRTNDPSRLLRCIRALLSHCDDDSLPLHEGIEQGHISLALQVIEQVAGMHPPNDVLAKKNGRGETVLLIGARCKAWEVVEIIAKKRSDLLTNRDVDENNVLHILASVNEDAGAQTMEKMLAIMPEEMQIDLLRETNQAGETPAMSAQLRGNTRCLELLAQAMSLQHE